MNKAHILNGILIGVVIVLLGILLLQGNGSGIAGAAERGNNPADTPRGTGYSAGGIIAAIGQYSEYNSALYLIDTNREVILTYACYPKNAAGDRSTRFEKPYLDFLCGRTYSWDAAFCQKGRIMGYTNRLKPEQIEKLLKENKDAD